MKHLKFLIIHIILITINIKLIFTHDPALKINLNPPEEDVKDTIEAMKDIDKLENDLRIGMDEDFDDEKKKLMEIQKARVHDIVHGAFIALKSLIPNPVKASIRKAIRDHLNGKGTEDSGADPSKSMKAVDPSETVSKINSLQQNINNLSKFKEKKVQFYERNPADDEIENNNSFYNNSKRNLRFKNKSDIVVDDIVRANSRSGKIIFKKLVDYDYYNKKDSANDEEISREGYSPNYNSELYNTNFPMMKPL